MLDCMGEIFFAEVRTKDDKLRLCISPILSSIDWDRCITLLIVVDDDVVLGGVGGCLTSTGYTASVIPFASGCNDSYLLCYY